MNRLVVFMTLTLVAFLLSACGQAGGAHHFVVETAVYGSDGHGWAVGQDDPMPDNQPGSGLVLRTADGGVHWSKQSGDLPPNLSSASFPDAQHGWVVGADSAILTTADGGIHWSSQQPPDPTSLESVSFADAAHGWAVGDSLDATGGGVILATSDGGARWGLQWASAHLHPVAAFSPDPTHCWVLASDDASQNTVILATSDGGANWTTQLQTQGNLTALSFVDSLHGCVGGNHGTILTTSDGGATWNHHDLSGDRVADRILGLSFVNDDHGWAISEGSSLHSILATSDGGDTWTAQKADELNNGLPSGSSYVAVSFSDAKKGWVATPGFILATNDGGSTWRSQPIR